MSHYGFQNYQNQNRYGYNGQNYYNHQYQAQAQINKQKVALIQDQNASNMIMCRVLSELENLAIISSFTGKKIFGYYATIPNNYQEIINQIIIQMKIFESSYKNFKKTNPKKQYIYPENLQYTNIINIVNTWRKFLYEKAQQTGNNKYADLIKYYDEFLNIISDGNLSFSFKKEFENLGKDSPPIDENELRKVMNAGATASCFINEKFNDIEEQIAKKGDYKVNAVLMGDRKDNPFYNNIDKYDQNSVNYKIQLYNYLNLMLAYLEKFSILNESSMKKITPKYSKNIKINSKDKDEIYKEYLNYIDKFFKFYNESIYKIPNEQIKQIISDIKSWKDCISNAKIRQELDVAMENFINQYTFDNK